MNELITVDNSPENNNFKCRLTTPSGVVYCEKDTGSPITMHGYLPHFAQYLHESGQLGDFINTCPLSYMADKLSPIFDKFDFELYDFTDASTISTNKMYTDGFHGNENVYQNI